ncbi:MAG TPA: hypothetical protein VD966_00610 [Pyrinomonadaceae bacterium]|nr:hypothetical protein [Pyrinomonadaceae bacterium]
MVSKLTAAGRGPAVGWWRPGRSLITDATPTLSSFQRAQGGMKVSDDLNQFLWISLNLVLFRRKHGCCDIATEFVGNRHN